MAEAARAGQGPRDWFDGFYREAAGDIEQVHWADQEPNPLVCKWLDGAGAVLVDAGARVLEVGTGLGDTAEELARRGHRVTAFDLSTEAVAWCGRRYPQSLVTYQAADLLALPSSLCGRFELVVEINTLQVLPPELRGAALAELARTPCSGGLLFVACRGRDRGASEAGLPWPLGEDELQVLEQHGMERVSFEDLLDDEDPPVRRFVTVWRRA